jgi:hypothetical protein
MEDLDINGLYCLYLRTYIRAMRGEDVALSVIKSDEQEALVAVALAVWHAAPAHGEGDCHPAGFDTLAEFKENLALNLPAAE